MLQLSKKQILCSYLFLFLLILLLSIIVIIPGFQSHTGCIRILMAVSIISALVTFLVVCGKKGFQYKQLLILILFCGFVMRIGYMLYTPYTIRQHDLGDYTIGSTGHLGYISWLVLNGTLPDTNAGTYYNPPLFHYLTSLILRLVRALWTNATFEGLMEFTKLISCFASCATLLTVYLLCEQLKLKERSTIVVMTISSFLPNMYLLAGRVNNDSLAVFFMILILLYTVKWYQNQSYHNIVCLGLVYGFGIMTKISCGIFSFVTGFIMLYIFFRSLKTKKWRSIIYQLVVFAVICFPLALWYPGRNLTLFDQPFTYVYEISKDSELYCGNFTLLQRFLIIPFDHFLHPLYNQPYDDYNILLYIIKGSLFGEFTFDTAIILPIILIILNTVLILLSMCSMIYMIFAGKKYNPILRYGMPGFFAVLFLSYLAFNLRYPFGCSMDFRYIVPTSILGAIFLGVIYEELKSYPNKIINKISYILPVVLTVFSLFSIMMFCMIK